MKIFYKALDGEEFGTQEECKKYEDLYFMPKMWDMEMKPTEDLDAAIFMEVITGLQWDYLDQIRNYDSVPVEIKDEDMYYYDEDEDRWYGVHEYYETKTKQVATKTKQVATVMTNVEKILSQTRDID